MTDIGSPYHSQAMGSPHNVPSTKTRRPLRHVRAPKLAASEMSVTKAIVALIAGLAEAAPQGTRKTA